MKGFNHRIFPDPMKDSRTRPLLVTLAILLGILAVSGIRPYDRLTWFLEVLPVLIAIPILWGTYRRFPLTTLLYGLIFFHSLVLILGAVYTYARVPLGFLIADWLNLERNPYDRIGHLVQGFVPAIVAREILIRGDHVRGPKMRVYIIVSIVLAISAAYEFIEWWVALAAGQGADQFLGTQGDQWDTQWDMFCAVIGAVTALLTLSGIHDRQMRTLPGAKVSGA